LLIYLSGDLQKKLIPLFHYSLNAGGVLLLGSAETVGPFTKLFAPLDAKARIYRRLERTVAGSPLEFPLGFLSTPPQTGEPEPERASDREPPPPNLERLVDRVLVQRFAPLGILCNAKGDVLYVSGRAGKYFEPPVGRAYLNILSMARDGLRYELSGALSKVARGNRVVIVRGVTVGTSGGTQVVDLTVQRLAEPKELRGRVLVVISDVADEPEAIEPTRTRKPRRVAELEEELQRARDEVQTTREAMQTSQEALKSTHEEMQSLNEELQTVNHELRSKLAELPNANNDMKNPLRDKVLQQADPTTADDGASACLALGVLS
jgi:two-component system CheB/CheR fusion protein